MASTNGNTVWDKIQQGVKETERLIGQKEYNTAMIKARQTLELMVKALANRACIVESSDLMGMIDSLYQGRWISKTTCEHYHKIRILGNKAVHEEDNNAYNANQAYHLLSQEVYTFANDYRNAPRGGRPARTSSSRQQNPSQGSRSRRRVSQKRAVFTGYDLLKLLIPILCIVLLFLVIKLVKPAKDDANPTTPAAVTADVPSEQSPEAPAADPETAAVIYKTTDVLNVRSQPSTGDNRIGQLEAGAQVEYVRAHDNEWAVIMYNGQEAYVASQYLTVE